MATTYELFKTFRENLSVKNAEDISTKYGAITKRLNQSYWESDSETVHSLQVGSYGRHTAIHGISDLDMAMELPASVYHRFDKREGNKQSALLQEVKQELEKRYPTSDVSADGQIIAINFSNYRVEVLPVFQSTDADTFIHPDSNDGGSWKTTKPKPELRAYEDFNKTTTGNLKHLCKMIRAWKNEHGVSMKGLFVDILCYRFLEANTKYNNATYANYGSLVKDFFQYVVDQGDIEKTWYIPGSNDTCVTTINFLPKAKKALRRCAEALDKPEDAHEKWRRVFGYSFPNIEHTSKSFALEESSSSTRREEFIEERYPVDIRGYVNVAMRVRAKNGFRGHPVYSSANRPERIEKDRKIDFSVQSTNIQAPYSVLWKIKNYGDEARNRGCLRGDIRVGPEIDESTSYTGNHYVECYLVKNGVCVARNRISVPIQ